MKAPDPGFGTRTRGWELNMRPLKAMRADPDPAELNEEPPALPAAPAFMPRAKLSWGASRRTTAKIEAQYSLCLARSISAPDISAAGLAVILDDPWFNDTLSFI